MSRDDKQFVILIQIYSVSFKKIPANPDGQDTTQTTVFKTFLFYFVKETDKR